MTYDDKLLQAFVGKEKNIEKMQWYKEAFNKFEKTGSKWKWSWWAFFFPGLFSFFRKSYLGGFLVTILPILLIDIAVAVILMLATEKDSIVPMVGVDMYVSVILLIHLLSGGYSMYFIYRRFLDKKAKIESAWEDEEDRIIAMKSVGGYNKIILWLIIIWVLLTIFGKMLEKGTLDNISMGSLGTPTCSSPETTALVKQLLGQNPMLGIFTQNKEFNLEMIRTIAHDKDIDRYVCKAKLDFGLEDNNEIGKNIMLQAMSNIKYSVSMTDDNEQFVVEILADQTATYTDDD